MSKLRVGDTVVLKSGGHVMTVTDTSDYGGGDLNVDTVWQLAGALQRGEFAHETLVKVQGKLERNGTTFNFVEV